MNKIISNDFVLNAMFAGKTLITAIEVTDGTGNICKKNWTIIK